MLNAVRWRLGQALAPVKWRALSTLGRRPLGASLYHAFLDDSLSREAASVLAGRARYRKDTSSAQNSYFLLRRNIHRLEKGLIMRPRRASFAADYIGETIDVYSRALAHALRDHNAEHLWARDVLCAYFAATERSDPKIAKAWNRFQAIETGFEAPDAPTRIPYLRDLTKNPVPFEDFMNLSRRRRSVRWFEQKPVDRALIDRALEAANQAPSACNRQPFVYRIIDNPERAHRVTAIPLGTKGFSDQVPSVVVLVGRLRAYPMSRDRHAIYIDGALSAMAFMYALETQGIASCPINWPDIQPQERMMAAELGLDADERVIMLIAYGWPEPRGLVPFSAKRDLDQLRSYE